MDTPDPGARDPSRPAQGARMPVSPFPAGKVYPPGKNSLPGEAGKDLLE
jgi:hypothetical protein